MRQTIVRILLDDLWTVQNKDGIDSIGVGWLLVPWLLYGIWMILQEARKTGGIQSISRSLPVVWILVAAGILLVPTLFAGRVAANGVPVRGYGFMLFLGFLVAAWAASRRAASVGIQDELIWDLAMWVFFSGIAGARLFFIVQYHERVFADKHGFDLIKAAVNLPDGGLVLYGGVILGIAAFFLFCKGKKLSPLLMADVAIPSIFIGLAFGRLGCFLNGCCYGDRCELPWSVTFPQQSAPFQALVARGFLAENAEFTIPLHPTQIYSSLNALMLAFLTSRYFRYHHQNGAVLAVGWMTYPITRFVIEYLRGDELGKFSTSLTISQWVSIGLFLSGLIYTIWLTRRSTGMTNVSSASRNAQLTG